MKLKSSFRDLKEIRRGLHLHRNARCLFLDSIYFTLIVEDIQTAPLLEPQR